MLCKSVTRFSYYFTRSVCRSFHMSDNPSYSENERTKCVNTNNAIKPPKILITGKHDMIKYNILAFDELFYK